MHRGLLPIPLRFALPAHARERAQRRAELSLESERVPTAWPAMGNTLHAGETHRVLPIVALAAGNRRAVERHDGQALASAAATRAALPDAETREVLAVATGQAGDAPRAQALRREAEEELAVLGAPAWGHALRGGLASLTSPA